MLSSHFLRIAEAIQAGRNASQQLQAGYIGYLSNIIQSWGYKQNSAQAVARRTIVMLENRIKKDKEQTIATWPEEKVKSTLLEYLEQQRILGKIRASKTLAEFPPENYFGLETMLLLHIDFHKKKGSIPADFSPELWWMEARDKTIDIFLEKIQAPGFILTSSLSNYLSGISRHVVDDMVKEKYTISDNSDDEEFLPEDFPNDEKEVFFSVIESEIAQLKNEKCRLLLRSLVNLFESVVEKERIDQSEVVFLRKVAIQELGKLLGGEVKRADKNFENCRKRFVVESFPKIQAEYGAESPFSPEFIEHMIKTDRQKLERERKIKRDWKAENTKAKKEAGDGIY